MPIAPIKYSQRVIRPYLMGLLPDNPTVSADIANRYNCSSENPFALLSHIGLDCPGAVQLVLEDATHLVESRSGNLAELSDSDLEKRLHLLRERASSPWETGRSGRWSLGGAQSKMALRYQDGRWYECEGSEPTTHILKPGVTGYDNQALDEYLCQSVAAQMGLPAAQVKYLTFGSEHAVSIQRYEGTGDTALLAPLYDIASIAPYQSLSPRRRKPLRAAMSIGGEHRFGLLSGRHLERLSRDANLITAGITREWIASAAERMATEIPSALQVVLNGARRACLAGIEQVGPALIREIGANCRRFLEQL